MEKDAVPPPYQATPSPPPQNAPVIITPRPFFGKHPVQLTCSNCHQLVQTGVTVECGVWTWIAVLVIFFIFFPLFWVPLVIDTCKDFRHYCPACHVVLGVGRII